MLLRVRAGLRVVVGLEAILIRRDDRTVFLDDVVGRRQADRCIGVSMIVDPPEDAFVDLRPLDQDFVVFLLGILRVAKLHQFARPIAVVATKPLARIVDAAILVAFRDRVLERIGVSRRRRGIRFELQTAVLRLGDHPDERNVGQRIVGIAAADVGMRAGEPDLADLLVLDETFFIRIEFPGRHDPLVP